MKKQKLMFNFLLRKFNKYKAQLIRFQQAGRNTHRQGVLSKHIARLQEKLFGLYNSINLKNATTVGMITASMMLIKPDANAQIQFAGKAGIPGSFGLSKINSKSAPSFVDIDNDGDFDLFGGDGDGNLYFLKNIGTASVPEFADSVSNPYSLDDVGYWAAPSFVDLDNDGDFDAVIGEYNGNYKYFENTGTVSAPAFAAVQTNPFGFTEVDYLSKPSFVDLDNDGDFDMISGSNYYGNLVYFENTGTASAPAFAAGIYNPFSLTALGVRASSPNFVDMDNDGDFDLIVGNISGEFKYFRNTGTASAPAFAAMVSDPFGLTEIGTYSNPSFVDIDDDGDFDMVSGESAGDFYYFKNKGTASSAYFANPDLALDNPFGLANIGYDSSPSFVDLDNDGDLDILAGDYYGSFSYFKNTGSSTAPAFDAVLSNPFGLTDIGYYNAPSFADLDNDGDFDLMVGENAGNFFYFENTGTATVPAFAAMVTNPFDLTDIGSRSAPSFVDLDNDGDFDLLAGEYNTGFQYFENTGTASSPAFAAVQTNPFSLTTIGEYTSPSFVDLDKDGDLDMLSGDTYGNFTYFENTGSVSAPEFAAAITNPFQLFDVGSRSKPAFGDLDGDGDMDLLSGMNSGNFTYFKNLTPISNTSIKTLAGETIKLFPNPTNDLLNIETTENINVEIVDVLGKTILTSNEKQIHLGNIVTGMYFIKIYDANFKLIGSEKILKK